MSFSELQAIAPFDCSSNSFKLFQSFNTFVKDCVLINNHTESLRSWILQISLLLLLLSLSSSFPCQELQQKSVCNQMHHCCFPYQWASRRAIIQFFKSTFVLMTFEYCMVLVMISDFILKINIVNLFYKFCFPFPLQEDVIRQPIL